MPTLVRMFDWFHLHNHIKLIKTSDMSGIGSTKIGFIENYDERSLAFLQLGEDCFLKITPDTDFGNNDADIGPIKNLLGFLHPHFTQGTDIIDAGGIDEQHRPDGQHFHRFFHRIGGGSSHRWW